MEAISNGYTRPEWNDLCGKVPGAYGAQKREKGYTTEDPELTVPCEKDK
jgi:hypothetical protein